MVTTMPILIPTPRTISRGVGGGPGVGVGKKSVSVLKEFGVEHGQISTT